MKDQYTIDSYLLCTSCTNTHSAANLQQALNDDVVAGNITQDMVQPILDKWTQEWLPEMLNANSNSVQ